MSNKFDKLKTNYKTANTDLMTTPATNYYSSPHSNAKIELLHNSNDHSNDLEQLSNIERQINQTLTSFEVERQKQSDEVQKIKADLNRFVQQQETPYSCPHPPEALNSCNKLKSPESFNEITASVEATNKPSVNDYHIGIENIRSKRE